MTAPRYAVHDNSEIGGRWALTFGIPGNMAKVSHPTGPRDSSELRG